MLSIQKLETIRLYYNERIRQNSDSMPLFEHLSTQQIQTLAKSLNYALFELNYIIEKSNIRKEFFAFILSLSFAIYAVLIYFFAKLIIHLFTA